MCCDSPLIALRCDQTLAIWRASKVHKRLRRLVELCGVKLLTLPQFSWGEKRTAFGYLVRVLEDYAAHRFKPPEAPAANQVRPSL